MLHFRNACERRRKTSTASSTSYLQHPEKSLVFQFAIARLDAISRRATHERHTKFSAVSDLEFNRAVAETTDKPIYAEKPAKYYSQQGTIGPAF
jgi:hypothetical protein